MPVTGGAMSEKEKAEYHAKQRKDREDKLRMKFMKAVSPELLEIMKKAAEANGQTPEEFGLFVFESHFEQK